MRIVIKECDRLKSITHKGKMVSEYLIYLMDGETPIECYNEVGVASKYDRVNEILVAHFVSGNWNENKLDLKEILSEVPYEEFIVNK